MFTKAFWVDAAERTIRTYFQALAGFLLAGVTTVNLSALDALALSGVPAALAGLFSILGGLNDPTTGASLLPAATEVSAPIADLMDGVVETVKPKRTRKAQT